MVLNQTPNKPNTQQTNKPTNQQTSQLKKKILFLTLYTFSLTGGIEKVCRALCKAISDFLGEGKLATFKTLSLHDENLPDEKYIDNKNFKGFNKSKFGFAAAAIAKGFNTDVIVLSHINLLLIAKIIKTLSPKTRIILIAHGIEVWKKLQPWKAKFLQKHVDIWAVSSFTANKLKEVNAVPKHRISILNNCLDPFFDLPKTFAKPQHLMIRYRLNETDKVVYSLARLSSAEQYKGYDKVIAAMQNLPKNIKYILAGKADEKEQSRVKTLIKKFNLKDRVFFAGFVLESELSDYYLLADVFALPSSGEGFGISFIEAAACGCPSIAGNLDGSRDALLNGKLGTLVNPGNVEEIKGAIKKMLISKTFSSPFTLQEMCLENFGFERYKEKIFGFLEPNEAAKLTVKPAIY